MIQLTFAFKTGTNQPPLTNNRDVNSFIIAKAQIDANLWKLWHSSIDLGPGFRSFFVQEALVSYCSIWLMDLFCSHSVYCIASLPKLENNGRKGPQKFRLFWNLDWGLFIELLIKGLHIFILLTSSKNQIYEFRIPNIFCCLNENLTTFLYTLSLTEATRKQSVYISRMLSKK